MAPPRQQFELALAILDAKLTVVQEDVREMKDILRGEYIRRDEFKPVKAIVFGLVGTILLAVAGALVTLVIRR